MILLREIRYVRLGTRDLDASARFARDILGLEPAGCDTNARYFRSDSCDHATAFELESKEALDAAGEVLEGLKRDVKWGTKESRG
jgi:2,3-dihydroxy-p-cumate/2,3-dihydroxybenzoate 3,4-dioxygenase